MNATEFRMVLSVFAYRLVKLDILQVLLNKNVDYLFEHLLNNTTLCANWSLPWGVLRS